MTKPRPLGGYGVDAPWVPWMWLGFAVLAAWASYGFAQWDAGWWSVLLAIVAAIGAVVYLAGAAFYWHASLRGKFVVWDGLLRDLDAAGLREAADLGCGRGAVAIMTALRLPEVAVTGVDLWRSIDQSGNSPEAAERNAEANGVAGRIRFLTGDLRELPLEGGRFGLVTASLSIHNIPDREGRAAAIREAVRILAPGGRLVIVDISKTREYVAELRRLGLTVDGPTSLGWRVWWTGPWMATSLVTASK